MKKEPFTRFLSNYMYKACISPQSNYKRLFTKFQSKFISSRKNLMACCSKILTRKASMSLTKISLILLNNQSNSKLFKWKNLMKSWLSKETLSLTMTKKTLKSTENSEDLFHNKNSTRKTAQSLPSIKSSLIGSTTQVLEVPEMKISITEWKVLKYLTSKMNLMKNKIFLARSTPSWAGKISAFLQKFISISEQTQAVSIAETTLESKWKLTTLITLILNTCMESCQCCLKTVNKSQLPMMTWAEFRKKS